MTKIYVQVTIYSGIDLLPHFLNHYWLLGADHFLVAAGFSEKHSFLKGDKSLDNPLPQIIKICRDYPTDIFPFEYQHYAGADNERLRPRILAKYGIRPQDWIIYADLDEFYSYPIHLKHLVEEMEKQNLQAIEGWVVDRVAIDGSLPPIQDWPTIFEQFPLGCNLTGAWCKANTHKIVLCKAHVQVNAAHDRAFGVSFNRHPVGSGSDYRAYHFRWTADLLNRLRERMQTPHLHHPAYVRESRFFLSEWAKNPKLPIDKFPCEFLGAFQYPPY